TSGSRYLGGQAGLARARCEHAFCHGWGTLSRYFTCPECRSLSRDWWISLKSGVLGRFLPINTGGIPKFWDRIRRGVLLRFRCRLRSVRADESARIGIMSPDVRRE